MKVQNLTIHLNFVYFTKKKERERASERERERGEKGIYGHFHRYSKF